MQENKLDVNIIQAQINKVLQAAQNGECETALYENYLLGETGLPEGELMRAELLMRKGFYNTARQVMQQFDEKYSDIFKDNPFYLRLCAEMANFNHQPDMKDYYVHRLHAVEPNNAKHYYDIAFRALQAGNFKQADDYITRGQILASDKQQFNHLRSYYHLFQYDYKNGYKNYAPTNDNIIQMIYETSRATKWQGQDDPNKILAVLGVYGLGDILGYLRFAVDIRQYWSGKLYGYFRKSMLGLVENMGIFDELHPFAEHENPSLPFSHYLTILHHLAYIIPQRPPQSHYIPLKSQKQQYWNARVRQLANGKIPIGLVWTRNKNPSEKKFNKNDYTRSLHLADLQPLWDSDKYQAFSLLTGEESLQNQQYPEYIREKIIDLGPELDSLETAGNACLAMHRVVSVCTMMINLCGAIGAPAVVLLHNDHGYPWGDKNGGHSWYPYIERVWVEQGGWKEAVLKMVKGWNE